MEDFDSQRHSIFNNILNRIKGKEFLTFRLMDILAIVAIIFAYIQFHDAKKTLDTLPTKYLQDYPENMNDIINQIINPSEQSLTIITGNSIYGIFSNSLTSIDYTSSLISKRNKLNMKLILYNYEIRKQEFLREFKVDKDSLNSNSYFYQKMQIHTCQESSKVSDILLKRKKHDSFTKDKDINNSNSTIREDDIMKCNAHNLSYFLSNYHIENINYPKSFIEFFNILEKENESFLNYLSKGVKITIDTTLNQTLSNSFWLSDQNKLAFSFYSIGKYTQESTFITHDPNIIKFVLKTY